MKELLKIVCGVGWACIELVSDLIDGPQQKKPAQKKKRKKQKRHRKPWLEERVIIERKQWL